MRDIVEKALLLEKKIQGLLEQGEKQASLQLTNEITEILSTTLFSLQQEKQKEEEENIQAFIKERLDSIKNEKTSIELRPGAKVVVHIIPISAFKQEGNMFDISYLKDKAYHLPQLTQGGYNDRFNYDGYLTYYFSNYNSSYVQVFRNGGIEIVDDGIFNTEEKKIFSTRFESVMIEKLPKYLKLLNDGNIKGPFFVHITFLKVKDYTLFLPFRAFFNSYKNDKDELHLPRVLLEQNEEDIAISLKPAFDVLWNSGGFSGSVNYSNGIWSPRN